MVSIRDFLASADAADFAALQACEGREWIEALPQLVIEVCRAWDLVTDGADLRHGYHAVVVPVAAGGTKCVLKLAWPAASVVEESLALAAWDGRGAVGLLQADVPRGVLLLERLDATSSLTSLPLFTAASEAAVLLQEMPCLSG